MRGVRVHLRATPGAQIRERAEYPDRRAAELLGEAAAAAALFTGHAKVDGRLSVQLRGHGALRTLFAECTAAGTLRGIAQLADDEAPVSRDLRELGPDAMLAITIENPGRARSRADALPGPGRAGGGLAVGRLRGLFPPVRAAADPPAAGRRRHAARRA